MNAEHLTGDPFLRRTAVIAAAIAAAVIIALLVSLVLFRGDPPTDFALAIGIVEPIDDTRVSPDKLDCPTDQRASSPIPGSEFGAATASPDRNSFGLGQVVAFAISVTAGEAPADVARLNATFGEAFAANPGVFCVFVVEDDPAHAEDAAGTPATARWFPTAAASGAEGQLVLGGMDAGETVIVQAWTVLESAGTDSPKLELTLRPSQGTAAETATRSDRVSLGAPTGTGAELTLAVDDGNGIVAPGGDFVTAYTITNPTDAVVNRINFRANIEGDARFTDVSVDDAVGGITRCDVEEGTVSCTAGFAAPGETITVLATAEADPLAAAFWGRDTGECQRDERQDLCQRSVLSWLGSFNAVTTELSEVTNLDDNEIVSVEASPVTPVAYARGSVNVDIFVTTDEVGGVTVVNASTSGCDEAIYVEGDTIVDVADQRPPGDGDGLLTPGEVWQFQCAARQYVDGLIEVLVQVEGPDGAPGQTAREVQIELIDPQVTLIRAEDDTEETSWLVTNTGDDPLTDVALSSPGCQPQLEDAADGDEILDIEEEWRFTCPAGAAPGTVFAIDSQLNTIRARDDSVSVSPDTIPTTSGG